MQQKVLILTAIPHGLRLDLEIRKIEEAIQRAIRREFFETRIRTAVRPQDIRRAIAEERPKIVHFCGHGLEDGSLLLEDDGGKNKPVSPEGLAALFKLHAEYVSCVLLNACHSAKSAEAIGDYINYAIGMNQPIGDKAAIAFSEAFYDALGYKISGNTNVFQRAFDEGVVAIKLESATEGDTPVLINKNISNLLIEQVIVQPTSSEEAVAEELNDSDIETLRKLLQLSGRAAAERRKALCIEIGLNSGELSAIWMLPENDFAVELIDTLCKRGLDKAICKLCQKLESDFKGGRYSSELAAITAKLNCK